MLPCKDVKLILYDSLVKSAIVSEIIFDWGAEKVLGEAEADCGARPPGRAILLRLQAISKAAPLTHCIFQIFVGLACACGMGRNLV